MRKLISSLLVATSVACAGQQSPPGGPEDRVPPILLSVSPESGSTNVNIKSIEFRFDEVVSDRPTSAAADLDQLFLISPYDGTPKVSWHRSRIDVRPRKGFRPNTAYSITILPGIADLRGNIRRTKETILISTGPTFPAYGILGRVFDWSAERPAPNAWVEAVSRPDSVRYVTLTDSVGQFDIGPLPAGDYTVYALIDQNNNRAIDRMEKWDSLSVKVTEHRPVIELDAIERDSIPPIVSGVLVIDSTTVRIDFDKAIDPTMPLQPALVRLQRADSTELEVTQVIALPEFERRRTAIEQARADSIRRADSLKAAAAAPAAPPAAAQPPAAPPSVTPARPTAPPPPKPKSPSPPRGIVIFLSPSAHLVPSESYRVTTRGIRNLVGNSQTGSITFTAPKPAPPPPPRDTATKPTPPPARSSR